MSASGEILRSWVRPRVVVRRLLDAPRREGRALSFLVIGCLLIVIAQIPRVGRDVQLGLPGADGGEATFLEAMTYTLFSWAILAPLIFYGIAALVHLLGRLLGSKAAPYDTRLALFWALLAATPAALLYGLVAGLIGPGVQADLTGALWLGGFAVIAGAGLWEASRG